MIYWTSTQQIQDVIFKYFIIINIRAVLLLFISAADVDAAHRLTINRHLLFGSNKMKTLKQNRFIVAASGQSYLFKERREKCSTAVVVFPMKEIGVIWRIETRFFV